MKKLLIILLTLLSTSCGKRTSAEKEIGLEGRWQSYESKCYRELIFLKDQFFQEVMKCQTHTQPYVSTGLWSRSGDIITMQYADSDMHGELVEISAIIDLDGDRILITDLNETIVFHRVSNKAEAKYPWWSSPETDEEDEDEEDGCTEVIINVNNNNVNQNDNNNSCVDATSQRKRGFIK